MPLKTPAKKTTPPATRAPAPAGGARGASASAAAVLPEAVAGMVALPTPAAVTRPEALTVATSASEEPKVAVVTGLVELSL